MPDLKDIIGASGGGLDYTVWTDARAAELDNISPILTDTAALDGRLTSTRAGYLDNIPAILTDTAALDGRLTDARAAKLDALSGIHYTADTLSQIPFRSIENIDLIIEVQGTSVSTDIPHYNIYSDRNTDATYAAFSKVFARMGGVYAQVAAANTWVTVCDITGSGFVGAMFSPGTRTGYTNSIRLTVDGQTQTYAAASSSLYDRLVIPLACRPIAYQNILHDSASNDIYRSGAAICHPSVLKHHGLLRFDSGFKMEIKTSNIESNELLKGGCIYMLDGVAS